MAGLEMGSGRSGTAGARALQAFLRARGLPVRLRVALPASGGDDEEQLGLATPGFEDREIGRGAFRKANSQRVLLVEARAGEALKAEAAGVVIGERLYPIAACEALRADGGVYGYALTLAARE